MVQNARSLGDFIREQRKLARLSLRDLAQLTRVSNAYLSQVERGLHEPSLRVLNAVAEALDVPLESMVTSPQSGTTQPQSSSVEEALRTDAWLSADQKLAMLTIYRSLVGPVRTLRASGTPADSDFDA